jgi:hypothetical protein
MEFNTYGTDCWSEVLQFFMQSLLLLAVLQHDICCYSSITPKDKSMRLAGIKNNCYTAKQRVNADELKLIKGKKEVRGTRSLHY